MEMWRKLEGVVLLVLVFQTVEPTGGQVSPQTGQVGDCSFAADPADASAQSVSTCNYTLSDAQSAVYAWRTGIGAHSFWIGGPPADASDSSQGHFENKFTLLHHLGGHGHVTFDFKLGTRIAR